MKTKNEIKTQLDKIFSLRVTPNRGNKNYAYYSGLRHGIIATLLWVLEMTKTKDKELVDLLKRKIKKGV